MRERFYQQSDVSALLWETDRATVEEILDYRARRFCAENGIANMRRLRVDEIWPDGQARDWWMDRAYVNDGESVIRVRALYESVAR